MSIAQLSPNSVASNPAKINPQAKTERTSDVTPVSQDAQRNVQSAKSDVVNISAEALKKASSENNASTEIKAKPRQTSDEKSGGVAFNQPIKKDTVNISQEAAARASREKETVAG